MGGNFMENRERFAVIGGDKRQLHLANILAQEGFFTNTYGIDAEEFANEVVKKVSISDAIKNVDVIIGPLPCSKDDETVNCMYFSDKIYFKDIFSAMNKNQLFFAGNISEKVKQTAHEHDIYTIDYLEREELAVLNSIPTAEGAIQTAMEEIPITIHGSKCLILGFGKIGKTLSKMLQGIGADVSVEARNISDLAWIRSYGYRPIHLDNLENLLEEFEIIFNTIPSVILNSNMLKKLKKNCLVIDLASKPGGVDFKTAKQLGIKTNWALSLPGKVAPYTAANAIKTTIFNIINELGV